jgi:RNA polymerase sigma-70 factor, ECF subfamily
MNTVSSAHTKNQIGPDEFDRLVNQHIDALQSFLYRLTASKEDAEDLSQETLLRAFKKINTYRHEASFKTWLFAIAVNLAKDHARAKKRWPVDAQDSCKQLIGSTPELASQLKQINRVSEYGRYEIREHIDFCFTCIMKTLPLEQHLALMLADIYSFKVKEIALVLDRTQAVVKHYLHNAKTTMQLVFEHRCALISKKGICHQCTELNGFNNTKAEKQRVLAGLSIVKASADPSKHDLFQLRAELVRAIDPLYADGRDLHDFLLKQTQKSLKV